MGWAETHVFGPCTFYRTFLNLRTPGLPGSYYAALPPARNMDCPGYIRLGGWPGGIAQNGSVFPYGSYGYNTCGFAGYGDPQGDPPGCNNGLGGDTSGKPFVPGYTVREGQVVWPSDMIALGDAALVGDYVNTHILSGVLDLTVATYPSWVFYEAGSGLGISSPWETTSPPYSSRHGGQWSVLFCDGHVEGRRGRDLFNYHSDALLRRWNRDHLPHRELLIASGGYP